jgi:hypothetical protein
MRTDDGHSRRERSARMMERHESHGWRPAKSPALVFGSSRLCGRFFACERDLAVAPNFRCLLATVTEKPRLKDIS